MEKLLWIDMEMTGLNVEREVVIEIAAIVTDAKYGSATESPFTELETYHAVVRQPQEYLDRMDDWNKQHHGQSGLTALVPQGREPHVVEDDLLKLIAKYWTSKESPIIAGNSINQDRLFINKYFTKLGTRLHYRMLDVTSWKIVMNGLGIRYEKKNNHRAVDDIRESIAELAHYLKSVKK